MLEGVPEVVEYVEGRSQPYLTSAICVFEVGGEKVGSGETDVVGVRQQFGSHVIISLNS